MPSSSSPPSRGLVLPPGSPRRRGRPKGKTTGSDPARDRPPLPRDEARAAKNDRLIRAYRAAGGRFGMTDPDTGKLCPTPEAAAAALAELVACNQGLVWTIAGRFANRRSRHWLKSRQYLEQMISDGNVGLLRAVEMYDPDHATGAVFSTYATYWIRQAIMRWGERDRIIRVPHYLFTDPEKLMADPQRGRDRESRRKLRERIALARRARRVGGLGEAGAPEDRSLIASVRDGAADAAPADMCAERHERAVQVREVAGILIDAAGLDEREAAVIRGRYFEARILEDVGGELGITREWARQLEIKAIEKLKRSARRLGMTFDF